VPIAIQVDLNNVQMELWVGTSRYPTSMVGAPLFPYTVSELQSTATYTGGIGHFQCYIAPATTWGFTQYLAQVAMAQTCLEGQLTGERVAKIADYAGVPTWARDIDPGTVRMQRAALAGLHPADAMETARATELGRLHMSGDSRLTFHDRRRIYNI
jgi:hypothetical protein